MLRTSCTPIVSIIVALVVGGFITASSCLAENQNNEMWFAVGKNELAEVAVERVLYSAGPEEHFLIHVRVTNLAKRQIGVDLRDYWNVVYPNQWGYSAESKRVVIDERHRDDAELTEEQLSKLKADFIKGGLTAIAPGKSIEYFREFNASTVSKVKEQQQGNFLIISLDGEQRVTDGDLVRQISLEWKGQRGSTQTDLVIAVPLAWKDLPTEALVIKDKR